MSLGVFNGSDSRSRRRQVARQRLDIQGLRMVAVGLVILSHLFDWPHGGFIGVDVFFVISGFLITGSLLHILEKTGRISFMDFYRKRIRRIVPAAVLVLVVTSVLSVFIFTSRRAESTLVDAVWALLFTANWRFASQETDYFAASGPVSPLQHYWSLSVEEQFYLFWPLLIMFIGILAVRRSWSSSRRSSVAVGALGTVVLASFIYSILETSSSPGWAYFSTLSRVWELGIGGLLAVLVPYCERIPESARPFIAWTGLVAIGGSAFLISEESGFPGPWAAVPVLGAALVIGAGVSGGHRTLVFLTNRVSTYLGDISYSLYLWHWPVIILLGAVMDVGPHYYLSAILLIFGFSIAAYHFFEDPIRKSSWLLPSRSGSRKALVTQRFFGVANLKMSAGQQSAGIGALALVTAGLAAFTLVPPSASAGSSEGYVPVFDAAEATGEAQVETLTSALTALSDEVSSAARAADWPELVPTMDDAIGAAQAPSEIARCGGFNDVPRSECTWGSSSAEHTMVLLGDSIAMTYAQALKNFVESSEGRWRLLVESRFGCRFADVDSGKLDPKIAEACPDHRRAVVESINSMKPDAVLIANNYTSESATEWTNALDSLVGQFSSNVGQVVLLAAPPSDVNIADCYTRSSKPRDCISKITDRWRERAVAEQRYSERMGGAFVDTNRWFCTAEGLCPSFVGSTPVKSDNVHMTIEYGSKISQVMAEQMSVVLDPGGE
ncbi:acyltransferase family protein [Rhodococcus sp. NPDC047139]|uniref:acyltransferase family protein n=1 Tax=Rhodococcus sp. NPDC047139 TaxID=3155141 RepID=UPI0033DF7E78